MSMRILFILSLITLAWGARANEQKALFDSAAVYYSNNQFENAIASYEKIIEQGFESAELYFNLGNAYYKSNKFAMAIVNYERAIKLEPNDSDIEFNLRLANTHVVDKIEVIPQFFLSSWWDKLIQLMSANNWAIISLASFVMGLFALLLFFLSHSTFVRRFSFWVGVLIIVVSVFTFSFARKQNWLAENEPDAVIITPSVVVRSAPSDSGTELFLIHEGLKISVTDKLGEWREIRLSDGNEGWVKLNDLVII